MFFKRTYCASFRLSLEYAPLDVGAGDSVLTGQQKSFLDRRLREAAEQQPDLGLLKGLLLGFGGVHLVAPPGPDPDLPLLIEAGFVMAGPVVLRAMKKSGCHENLAELWASNEPGVVGIGTGYSLSDDGLWRQHSWGIRREGILETTASRVKYFGVLLQRRDADMFAIANQADWRAPRGTGKRKKGTGAPRSTWQVRAMR